VRQLVLPRKWEKKRRTYFDFRIGTAIELKPSLWRLVRDESGVILSGEKSLR
jgi:hypothetical protein